MEALQVQHGSPIEIVEPWHSLIAISHIRLNIYIAPTPATRVPAWRGSYRKVHDRKRLRSS